MAQYCLMGLNGQRTYHIFRPHMDTTISPVSQPQASSLGDLLNAGKKVVQFKGLEEFGLVLYCGPISEYESAELESANWKLGSTTIDPNRIKRARIRLLALTVCDQTGKRILDEETAKTLDSRIATILYDQAYAFTHPKPKNLSAVSGEGQPTDSQPNADGLTSINC